MLCRDGMAALGARGKGFPKLAALWCGWCWLARGHASGSKLWQACVVGSERGGEKVASPYASRYGSGLDELTSKTKARS